MCICVWYVYVHVPKKVRSGSEDSEDTIISKTNAASMDAFPGSTQVRIHQHSVTDRRTQRTCSSLMTY